MDGDVHAPPSTVSGVHVSDLNAKSTIRATGSGDSLFHVLNRDWIYLATATIDASMLPGHIVAVFEITPMDSHKYVRHVAQMFKFWCGSMHFKCRFAANAMNGGKFHITQLPPTFTREEINQLDLETLTAYPYEDLDPKDTTPKTYTTVDERNVAFHRLVPRAEDRNWQDRAGWFVIYVVAPLVQSLNATGSVSLVIETAGNFDFRQVAPLGGPGPGPTPTSRHPLERSQNDIFHQNGCDDFTSNGKLFGMQILGSATTSLPNGYVFASGVGDAPWTFNAESSIDPNFLARRASVESGAQAVSAMGLCMVGPNPQEQEGALAFDMSDSPTLIALNGEVARFRVVAFEMNPPATNVSPQTGGLKRWNGANARFEVTLPINDTQTRTWSGDAVQSPFVYATDFYGALLVSDMGVANVNQKLVNPLQGESIIVFCNFATRTMNLQTSLMADDLAKATRNAADSYIYHVRSDDHEGPLMLVRLHPSGMFTTYGQAQDAVVIKPGARVWLQFVEKRAMSSPLPPMTTTLSVNKYRTRRLLNNSKMSKLLRDGGVEK